MIPIVPSQLRRLDTKRKQTYKSNLDFYNGLQWTGNPKPRERQLTLNYTKTLIDKMASYMMSELTFAVDPLTDTPEGQERARAAEQALRETYEANQLALLDFDTEIDTSILGDGAFKVTWDTEEQRVRVSAPDVQGIYVWTRTDDLTRIAQVASQYQADDKVTITEIWTPDRFQLYRENNLETDALNPYKLIPYVIFPNLRQPKHFWGESDIPPIRESQNELNRALSTLSMIMELSGNPIAVLENVESSDKVEVKPGAVWELPEKAKAYLLDLLAGGGVALHIDYINTLYRTLHDLGETPRTAFGDNQRNLSGVALEVELVPLLQKVKRKQLIRTTAYRQRNTMILRLLEQFTGIDYQPHISRVVWGSVTPKDRTRIIQDERLLNEGGMHSLQTAMNNLGVADPQREFEQWLEEKTKINAIQASTIPLTGDQG